MATDETGEGRPRVGVSACLVGKLVRFDGGHAQDDYVRRDLAAHVDLMPVCPEIELGLGAPRETMRFVRRGGEVRLVTRKKGDDLTDRMSEFADARARALSALNLSGFVLKKDSPSCGLERVRVYPERTGPADRTGVGLFAQALRRYMPDVPMEEEGRLRDPLLRESFVERVFLFRRLQLLFGGRWTMGELVAFHSGLKLLLLAHEPEAYRELGRLVAEGKALPKEELAARYRSRLIGALAKPPTRYRHVNVLEHMAGYLRGKASDDERREVEGAIADYRRGIVPLVAPLTLLRHLVRRYGLAYLGGQFYLHPEPRELLARAQC